MNSTILSVKNKCIWLMLFLSWSFSLIGQTSETIASGAYIIDMGVTPQTVNNGLKPYGMLYDLLNNYKVPIKWVINQSKVKDGIDFSHNGKDYRGGPFIIPAEYRTAAVNSRITYWQGQGVVGASTVSPITVPVVKTFLLVPKWTLDSQNGAIAQDFFSYAGIPSSAYNWKLPSTLDCCDDLFVMPHADPKWSSHGNLLTWNLNCKGGIWLGCHAGSALEDMFNPSSPSQQTNFLAEKTGTASGAGPWSENALVLWGNHSAGTLPYSYDYPTDPIMQFMGILDAATQNGSEQIYITKSPGWRSTTKVGVYDPDHPQKPSNAVQHRAAIVAWGPGLGDTNRGQVMLEAAHDIAKATGTANVAAMRAFFNFSFVALADKTVIPTMTGLPSSIAPGTPVSLGFTVPAPASINNFTVVWSASCSGTFSPSNTSLTPTFTSTAAPGATCIITAVIKDNCGRETFASQTTAVTCELTITTTATQPCPSPANSGSISMSVTGGTAPYSYSWSKSGGGSGSGSGTTISGLDAGTYSVTVTSANGCVKTFTTTLTASPSINITATPVAVLCNGGATGAINLSVSGGTPGYTYNWGGGVTTQNRSGLSAGAYSVTVSDSKGCTSSSNATVTQPTTISATPTVTNVLCHGTSTGAISLNVSGGTSPYIYLWNDGTTSQNRTGIAAGTYAVTITDANNCTRTVTGISVTQPASALSAATSQVNNSCNSNSDGSITATVSGGTSPFTYDWTGNPSGDGTATITGLASGTYSVTVTDANACSTINSATIGSASPLLLSNLLTQPSCPPSASPPVNSDGAINLTVSGGTAPYTYLWNTLDGTGLNLTAEDQSSLTVGTYFVTVTDANGCNATGTFVLTNANPLPTQPGTINND